MKYIQLFFYSFWLMMWDPIDRNMILLTEQGRNIKTWKHRGQGSSANLSILGMNNSNSKLESCCETTCLNVMARMSLDVVLDRESSVKDLLSLLAFSLTFLAGKNCSNNKLQDWLDGYPTKETLYTYSIAQLLVSNKNLST